MNPIPIPQPGLLGRIGYHLLPFRRRLIMSNLELAFGSRLSRDEIEQLAKAAYAHFARLLAENVVSSTRKILSRSRVENAEAYYQAAARGKGVLFLTAHTGNWEWAPRLVIEGVPELRGRVSLLRRPLRIRWLERIVVQRCLRAGCGVLPKTGSFPAILERLKNREAVAFVMDQHAATREGVVVDFFGQPASTFRSLALAAIRSGAPVVPFAAWREPNGTQVGRFDAPLETLEGATRDESVRINTRVYNSAIERMILAHPEQWIWMHRRWRKSARITSPRAATEPEDGADQALPPAPAAPG